MKAALNSRRAQRGSALLTVVMLVGIMAILTASILRYTITERRANERQRLVFRANNMAENLTLYAAEQVTTKLYRLRSFTPMAFMSSNPVYLPPDDILTTSFSTPSGMEIRAGLQSSTGLQAVSPTDTSSPYAGLYVSSSQVPIIAKATMNHPQIGNVTAYCQHNLEVCMVPLFQFAVFYNMDLELFPGADMVISGPVHTNGNLIARCQTGFTVPIEFTDRVSATGGYYANSAHKAPWYTNTGGVDNGPGGDGALYFTNPTGTKTQIKGTSGADSGVWRDHKYGASSESATTLSKFKTFATSNYAGNLRTSVHGVTNMVLPAISNYKEVNDPATTEDERNNGRQVIEAPKASDTAGLAETKFGCKAGLYIIVNPDTIARDGNLPNGAAVTMRAKSYRCWLNTTNADATHTLSEIILPGQPSYGALNANVNNLPNAYRTDTSVRHNQVLRIPQGGGVDLADTGYATGTPTLASFQDAYFYDMRRATGNYGYPFNRSSSTPYTPRPISKIDFDMTRFRMAVERTLLGATTSSIYFPSRPSNTAGWNNFIFNPSATKASYGLGLGSDYTSFPAADAISSVQRTPAAIYAPSTITVSANQQAGAGSVASYAGRFIIDESTSVPPTAYTWGAAIYTSTADESSYTYTPTAGSTVTAIRVRLCLAGVAASDATKIDEQIIPIVTANTTTPTGILTNDFVLVPSNSGGASPLFTNATTDMFVYIGATDDTANWTFSAATSSGVTGSFGTTATTANRYTVTGMTSSTTSTVTITAAKSGATSIVKTFTLRKQSDYTGSAANAASPTQTGRWLSVSDPQPPDPFRIYLAPADPADTRIKTNPSTFAVSATDLVNTTAGAVSPWYDGITIYVHSVAAETRNGTRVDSGVRLWHGRGPVVSLDPAANSGYTGRTGLSFATNDAAYIVGHYNADGTINATKTSTGAGGYSGRYPDSTSEMLTSTMADAVTILSQPVFNSSYVQTSGWSDSLSSHKRDDSNWSSSWATTNPSSSNSQDGIADSYVPANMPNQGSAIAGLSGTARTYKFAPSVTEISTCLLVGIVPSNHKASDLTDGPPSTASSGNGQSSGGLHNYPRLLEDWNGTVGLYIRGSMVAMFESRVAMEPWSLRVYSGADRYWGLHQSLRDAAHDLPLEPILLNARRKSFKEITAAEYATMKATIEALPH